MVKICGLGAASQDVFLTGKGIQAQLDPRTNEYVEEFKLGAKLAVEGVIFSTGGGATNAAVTFARQGLDSSFIGRIGDDVAGHIVIAELDKEHIDSSKVIKDTTKGTQYSTVLLAESGERTILIYRGAAQEHRAADYATIDFAGLDWIYVSSFAGKMEALDVVFTRAKAKGVKIAFNPGEAELDKPDELRALLEDVDILLTNKDEAVKIVEGVGSADLAHHMLNYVSIAVVSDGPNGVYATDGKTAVEAGLYEDVPVIDRTGAGDAFGSGFVSQIALGRSLKDAVIYGSANSTSVVTKIGAKAGILGHDVQLHDMPIKEEEL